MKSRALLLAWLLGLPGTAAALTVKGSVDGTVAPDTRLGGFVVTPFGQALQELGSVPLGADKFTLDLPSVPPAARAQGPLTPQNVAWPGVLDPVSVSARVQSAELKFFTYRDSNGNARRDEGEALREVTPNVGGSALFVAWVSGDVKVTAARGFSATLKEGWNAFLVDVGKAVRVRDYDDGAVVNVRLSR